MIKVTIIMPSLNVVNYIDECIQSVINQTLKEVQIICVDAGSTDGTYVLTMILHKDHIFFCILLVDFVIELSLRIYP